MVLNDSSLFSSSADITTKEILKRYGDRAKAPTIHSAPGGESSNNGTTSPAGGPLATRVEADPSMQSAWQHETSVRHVGAGDASATPPSLPYAANGGRRDSGDSHGSPNRGSIRGAQYDKQRAMGVA